MNLREGLTVDFLETCFHADCSSTVYLTHPTVSFPFYLSGVKRMTCASASGKETILFDGRVGGLCSAAYYRELEYEISIKGGVRNVYVCVNISPSLLQTFLDDRSDGLPGVLRDIARGADRKEYGHTAPLTPPMSSALYEMLHCPYTGPIRKIFMEGKALELVAHKLAQIQAEKKSPGPTRFDRRDDLDRIYHAENLLNERLEKPPMLSELAGAVGVSYKKLNA
ncbi:MAG: hypothetical protein GY859_28055, partial [Desulfobacterales bacterium]|nr:hypothetical protein [Desulfobacterales bacterium]